MGIIDVDKKTDNLSRDIDITNSDKRVNNLSIEIDKADRSRKNLDIKIIDRDGANNLDIDINRKVDR